MTSVLLYPDWPFTHVTLYLDLKIYLFIEMFVAKNAYLSVNRVEKPGMATDNSLTGMETLEGFVMGLYLEAFQALVSLINRYESLYLHGLKHVV